jgi:hypothetical protein
MTTPATVSFETRNVDTVNSNGRNCPAVDPVARLIGPGPRGKEKETEWPEKRHPRLMFVYPRRR